MMWSTLVTGLCCAWLGAAEPPAPSHLLVNLVPAGLAPVAAPLRWSWRVNAVGLDQVQTAWQVELRQGERAVWDSGRVAGSDSVAVPYRGPALSPGDYTWRVRVWDRDGQPSAWAAPQPLRLAAAAPTGFSGPRLPVVQTPVAPVAVVAGEAGHWFLDFGRASFGGLKLTFTAPVAGAKVVVHLGEVLAGPGRVHRSPGGSRRYLRAELALAAGEQTVTVPLDKRDARLMPANIGPVMPFRYVEVEGSPSPLDARTAVQLVAHYPFGDQDARFESSNHDLDAVWELCRHTMRATSFGGLFVDGDRERLPYEADAYINQLGWYATTADLTLPRYSHEHLLLHPTWPTEWLHHSVMMALADYLYTGDDASLRQFYGDLQAKTLSMLAREDGLISTVAPKPTKAQLAPTHRGDLRDIVDWPMGERDGYDLRPVNTVVNAFYYRSLADMARIAEALGRADDAGRYRQQAAQVAATINAKLVAPATGLYLDGEGSRHSALHANMVPLAFGLVPPERVKVVADFVESRKMACSVYGAQYLLEALFAAGRAQQALALMLAPGDRSWRHMVRDVGTTIALEAWDNRYKPNQDWNHAWGAAPANLIPRCLLGVEPLTPGFGTVRLKPQPGGLARADLTVPTVRGPLRAAFESTPERFVLDCELPANMRAEVWLPPLGQAGAKVWVDGRERAARDEGAWAVITGLGSGRHRLERR